MGYSLSRTSKGRLDSCHNDLKIIINEAIKLSRIDFGVAEGYRSVERQKELFDEGKSRIDGINKRGMHNYSPSLALDVYAYWGGKAQWDSESLCYIGGLITSTADRLLREGKITKTVRWGGNWDRDDVIVHDQSFDDLPHFELR